MVIQIAKAELRNLFYSPVAWFLILLFLVQCAYFFTDLLVLFADLQDVSLKNKPDYEGIKEVGYTRMLFLEENGIFMKVLQNFYLFVPLLTMGLIGREVQHGTFRLLYSAPVKLRQIVMGKYLAIMLFNVILVLLVGIFLITGSLSMQQVDYGMLFSAALGFYLLTCAYTAIGMFMSSITTHQIIAAVGIFLIVFCLSFIGNMWQQYDFVRDLTFFLHLPGRADKMLIGLITTKDVIYFLVIVYMFLGFTILRLRAAREAKPWYMSLLRYSAVIMSALTIGYISSRPMLTGYWDTTAQDVNTISEKTQQLIKKMGDEPLEVTLYTNFLGQGRNSGLPERRNFYLTHVWEKFVRFKPDIKFNFVYYYDHDSTIMGNALHSSFPGKSLDFIFAKIAEYAELDTAGFLKPAQIRRLNDMRPENLRLVMQLKYKGRTEFLRTYPDPRLWPDELHVATVFKRLIEGRAPKIAFITGHYERNIFKTGEREYANHTAGKESRSALVNIGYDVDTINLDTQDIPADLTNLVLADPKSALSPACQEKIRQYINKGGNMFIMGEPGKQQIVNPVLKQLGVNLMDGILVSPSEHETPDMVVLHPTKALLSIGLDSSGSKLNNVQGKQFPVLMPGVTAIDYTDSSGFISTALLLTSAGNNWLKKGKLITDSAQVEFDKEAGDLGAFFASDSRPKTVTAKVEGEAHAESGAFTTFMAMHRTINNKEQRVVVAGDADFMSNIRPMQHRHGIKAYSWLGYGEYPIYMYRPELPDKFLTISGKRARTIKLIYVWMLPSLVLLAGTLLLIRRKRK